MDFEIYKKKHKKGGYIVPKGRLAEVSAVQDYSKHYKVKVEHFHKKGIINPRYMKRDEYKIKETEYPLIHKKCPKLLHGKVKKNYKQNDIFQIGGDKSPPKKIKEPKFAYRNPMTGQWN